MQLLPVPELVFQMDRSERLMVHLLLLMMMMIQHLAKMVQEDLQYQVPYCYILIRDSYDRFFVRV